MTPWNDRQISRASKISFADLFGVAFDVGRLISNNKKIGDGPYTKDAEYLNNIVTGFMTDHDGNGELDTVAVRALSTVISSLKERAAEMGDGEGAKIIEDIERQFLGDLVNDDPAPVRTLPKTYARKPETPEEARAQALESYRDLIGTMFENIGKNLATGVRASKALAASGKICDVPEDEENGEYAVKLLEALSSAACMAKDLFDEKTGEPAVTADEWERIDRIRRDE